MEYYVLNDVELSFKDVLKRSLAGENLVDKEEMESWERARKERGLKEEEKVKEEEEGREEVSIGFEEIKGFEEMSLNFFRCLLLLALPLLRGGVAQER